MSKRRFFTFIPLLLLLFVALACAQSQPSSQQQQLQATISALQTQVAARQNQPFTPTPASEQSQERQLQATIVALQTQVAQPPSGPSTVSTLSPTPLQDTVPGTILEVGQSWYQDNLRLELRRADIEPEGIPLEFYLTSFKTEDIVIQYNLHEALSAVDNLGRKLEIVADLRNMYVDPRAHATFQEKVRYGEPVLLKMTYVDVVPFVPVNPADLNLNEVIVTINIHTIREARWRVRIPH